MSDLERTIAGLAQFEQKCPPQIRCLGHFGAFPFFVDARNLSFLLVQNLWKAINRLKFGENAKCGEPCSSPTQTKWLSYSRSLDTSTNNRYRGFNSLNSTCLWGGDWSCWTKSCQNKERFQHFLAKGNQKTMLKTQKPMKLSLEKIRGVNWKLKLQSETFKIPGLKNTNGWSTINRRVCSVRVASNLVNPIL